MWKWVIVFGAYVLAFVMLVGLLVSLTSLSYVVLALYYSQTESPTDIVERIENRTASEDEDLRLAEPDDPEYARIGSDTPFSSPQFAGFDREPVAYRD